MLDVDQTTHLTDDAHLEHRDQAIPFDRDSLEFLGFFFQEPV